MFVTSLNRDQLTRYTAKQMSLFFPDDTIAPGLLLPFATVALQRMEYCFSRVNIKYYFDGKDVFFNHLNTDQYAVFLYYLSNTIWKKSQDEVLASKAYYLNKVLHSVDLFYQVSLPDIFLLVHPLGTVLGRGDFQDYLVVYQRVTVGADKNDIFPKFGKGVVLYGGSSVIGDSKLGDNCLVSAGTKLLARNIPDDMAVFEKDCKVLHKPTHKSVTERYFLGN